MRYLLIILILFCGTYADKSESLRKAFSRQVKGRTIPKDGDIIHEYNIDIENEFEYDEDSPIPDRPEDEIKESYSYEIFAKVKRDDGFYEYWVKDGSEYGWIYISKQDFDVGDRLKIGRY